MVEWSVLLPHIHEVLGLILNLMVAILKFFMDLPKYFEENNGQYLQQASAASISLLIHHPQSPSHFLIQEDFWRAIQNSPSLKYIYGRVCAVLTGFPSIYPLLTVYMALLSNENWCCCLALYSKYQFKQCSEVNQTYLCLINNQEACDRKCHSLYTLNHILMKFILFLVFLILFRAGQLYVLYYNVVIIFANHMGK